MIETERLLLREMRWEDVEDLLYIFSDPLVTASFGGVLMDRARMEQWIQRNLDHQEQHGYGLFSVILKGTDLLIGDCGLECMEVAGEPEVELGYDFRSDHWNRGFATEAAAAARDFAFRSLRLPRLVSLIRAGNRASQRVAEKIGMKLDGEIMRSGQAYWVYAISPPGL